MCCVLQAGGAERVFPSSCSPTSKRLQLLQLKDSRALQDEQDGSSPATAHDLPLESLWAAGLDDGMGFPRRCSYANQRSANAVNANGAAGSFDSGWRERRACRTLGRCSSSRPDRYDSSPRDEIWTLSRELGSSRYGGRAWTTSTGIGSSLNLRDDELDDFDDDPNDHEYDDYRETNERSLDHSGWSRSCARFGPRGSSTSGFGSSSTETRHGGGSFSRNKSLQAIVTRQPMSQRQQQRRNGYPSPDSPPPLPPPTIASRNRQPQARRSFSTSLVAELALVTSAKHESQRSLDSPEYLELERSYDLSTPGDSSPTCCPPCSPPPAPAAYISSARASSARRLGSIAANSTGLSTTTTSPDRDPLGKLLRYLKTYYRELGTRDPPHLPQWASPLPLGTLCPAHFQPHLQIIHKSEQEHRLENIKMDQIFASVRLGDGTLGEAPRRVSVEGGPGSGRTSLCLRLLYQWATQPSTSDSAALAFVVPLRELRGGTLLSYLSRELFPRGSALAESIQAAWRSLHLLEDRLLFVLDGYEQCSGGTATSTSSGVSGGTSVRRQALGDALDLLEGRLFPEARLLLTCSPQGAASVAPLVHRRLHLAGLEWPHVERLCVAYFIHNDLAEKACDFLELINVQPLAVRQLAQHPLGWLMLCALYQDSGAVPSEMSSLVQSAVKCIVRRSLEPPLPAGEELPGHCRKRLEDFGKLALAALREGRTCYTESELRSRGGGIEIVRLGFLNKGTTLSQQQRRGNKCDLYTPIHLSVIEFLAAYYLSSVAQYANIVRRELEGLPPGILGHVAGLLGPKAHLVLNQLCPAEVPARLVFSLLQASNCASEGNVSAVCRLVGGGGSFGPAPSDRSSAPLVHTSPLELQGWARLLSSPACSLEALELVFQLERGSDPSHLERFFDALARDNESVRLVRITSLLGHDFADEELRRLAEHVRAVLSKRRLHEFELVITCLDESAHDRLECVVSGLCRGLSQASSQLCRLVLDMNLSGEQVSRVCSALRRCGQVQALHLPHLGCGYEGLSAIAELIKERPLLALNLTGSWAAKNDDPSSSGISMGSGSGSASSAGSSAPIGHQPGRCYSSLPRGALTAYGGSSRPATLPRLPPGALPPTGPSSSRSSHQQHQSQGQQSQQQNQQGDTGSSSSSSGASSKRNSDSVLSCNSQQQQQLVQQHGTVRSAGCVPTCEAAAHRGSGFHEVFHAIREPGCRLRSLNVSKCLLGGLDAACLGETVRRASQLDALRCSGASRPADVMPLLMGLAEGGSQLQLLDLSSPRLALDDHPCRLLCHALARNASLRLLNLDGWTFRIEESETLLAFAELLSCTGVRELSLCNARLHLAVHEGPLSRLGRRDDAGAELMKAAAPPTCPNVVFLRLAGFQVAVNDRLALRGPQLLPFLSGFTNLLELDLSLDKSAALGGLDSSATEPRSSSPGSPTRGTIQHQQLDATIDERQLIQFFTELGSHFRQLQSLRANFWRCSLDECSERVGRQVAKLVRTCKALSVLRLGSLVIVDRAANTSNKGGPPQQQRVEHVLLQALLSGLDSLAWLSLDGLELNEAQADGLGKCLRERFRGASLEISARDVGVEALKALVGSAERGGRAEVSWAGGPTGCCRLRIEKLQNKARARPKSK